MQIQFRVPEDLQLEINAKAGLRLQDFLSMHDDYIDVGLRLMADAIMFNDESADSCRDYAYFMSNLIFMLRAFEKEQKEILQKVPDPNIQRQA